MDEEKFTAWLDSALAAMHGLAISIAIIGHTAHLSNSTITNHRLVGANARDVVSIIDSLSHDKYRDGGVCGLLDFTIGQINKSSGCWLDRTFRRILEDLKAVRAKKPTAILSAVEQMRRDSTAHFHIAGKAAPKPPSINACDMWQAYDWLKEMFQVLLSGSRPAYQWNYDEQDVIDAVLRDLSSPILRADQSTKLDDCR